MTQARYPSALMIIGLSLCAYPIMRYFDGIMFRGAAWTHGWWQAALGFLGLWAGISLQRYKAAQAMETRRDETEGLGAKHDSAVAESDVPLPSIGEE